MGKKLVISYSDSDRAIAVKVRDQLVKAGHEVWIARDNIKGDVHWSQSILDAIDSHDGLVLIWSASAAKSPDVHEEIRIARVFLKPIFPLLACPMSRVPPLPSEIQTLQVIQTDGDEANVRELQARLADPQRSSIQYPELAEHGVIPRDRNPFFVGRSRELKTLFVDSRGYRGRTKAGVPIAISGLAGIGKTQLALEFGYRFNLFFPDGVYWVDAPNSIVREFAKLGPHLRVKALRDEAPYDYAIRVKDKLSQLREGLVIFDNITNMSEFREWRPQGMASCSVILTSRIPPRGFPARVVNLTELDPDSAYDMLITRRRDGAEISRDAAQREALEELCRVMGNHPLALELCASRLQSEFIKPSDYLKEIQPDPLGRLRDEEASEVSLGVGTASLADILSNSYASLDAELVDPYFLLICCFAPSGINEDLIVQAYGTPDRGRKALSSMADISLISQQPSHTLSLHPLVAQFGRGLQKRKHFDYPGKFVDVMLGFLRTHDNALASEEVRREKPHIDEALRVAQETGLWEACTQLHIYDAVVEGGIKEQVESLEAAYQIIEQHLPQQKNRLPGLRLQLGKAHRTAGRLAEALADLKQAEVLYREAGIVDPAQAASLHFELGTTCLALGLFAEAEKTLSDALKAALTSLDSSAPAVLQLREALAEHALALGDYDKANAGFMEILGSREKFYTAQPDASSAAGRASARADLSRLALARTRYADAIRAAEAALAITKEYHKESDPDCSYLYLLLGSIHYESGAYGQAEELLDKAEHDLLATFGQWHPGYARALMALAKVYRKQGKFDKAEKAVERSIAIFENVYGKNHPSVAEALEVEARIYDHRCEFDKEQAVWERVLHIQREFYSEQHPALAATHYDYATLFLRKSEYSKAVEHLESSLRITEQSLGKQHVDYFGRLVRLATCRYEQQEYSRAQENFAEAKGLQNAIFGDSPHPYIARMLQLESEILRRQGKFTEALQAIDQAIAMKETIYGTKDHPSVAEALEVKVKIFHHLGEETEAKLLIDRALAIRRKSYGENHPEVSRSIHDLGSYYLRLGQYDQAVKQFEQARQITATVFGVRHPDYVERTLNLANARYQQGDYQLALDLVEEVRGALPAGNHYLTARWLQLMSEIQRRIGQFGKAMDSINQTIAMKEAIYGKDHPSVAEALEVKVKIFHHLGEETEAKLLIDRALAIRRKSYGENHPEVSRSIHDLGSYYLRLGQYDQAVKQFEQARQITATVFSVHHPDYVERTLNLANARYQQGDYQLALDLVEEVRGALPAGNHYLTARWLQLMSEIQRRRGQFDTAMDSINQAIAMKEIVYGKDHPSVAEALEVKVKIFHHLGEETEAKLLIDRALAIRRKSYGENHPEVSRSIHDLGSYYLRLGQYDQAVKQFEQARQITATVFSVHHPDYVERTLNLANARYQQGDYQLAFDLLEEVRGALPAGNHYLTARWLQLMGELQGRMGQFETAMDSINQAIAMKEIVYGKDHPSVAEALEVQARIYDHRCEFDKEQSVWEHVLKIQQRFYSAQHPALAATYQDYANLYLRKGEYAKSLDLLDKSLEITEKSPRKTHASYFSRLILRATCLCEQQQYVQAQKVLDDASSLQTAVFGHSPHPLIARMLQLQSQILRRQGRYAPALKAIDQAIAMKKVIYGREEHPWIAEALEVKVDLLLGELQVKRAREILPTIERIRRIVYGKNHPDYASYQMRQAEWYEMTGQFEAAIEILQQSLQTCLSAFSVDHPETIRRQIMLARLARMVNDIVGADRWINAVRETLGARLATEDSLIVAETLQETSSIRRAQGDYRAALAELEKALTIETEIFGSESPEVIELQKEKAKLLILFRRRSEADGIIESALQHTERNRPVFRRLKSDLLEQRAVLLVQVKRYDQALDSLEQAIKLTTAVLGDESVESARQYIEKAVVLRHLGKHNEALASLAAAYYIDNLHLGENHIFFARILLEQGQTYLDNRSFWEAQEHLKEALSIYDKQPNRNVKQHADAAEALGRNLLENGLWREASEMFQEALDIRTAIYGGSHPEIAEALYYQAKALAKMPEAGHNKDLKTKARHKLDQALNMLGQRDDNNAELISSIEHTLANLQLLRDGEMIVRFSSIDNNDAYSICHATPATKKQSRGSFVICSVANAGFESQSSIAGTINGATITLSAHGKSLSDRLRMGNKSINQLKLWKLGYHIPHTVVLDFSLFDAFKREGKIDLRGLYDQVIASRLGPSVAVRCSSNLEDSDAHSFAGAFDTYLDVPNRLDEIQHRIVRSYQKFHSKGDTKGEMPQYDVKLSILVQQMIRPKFSGFMFTRDPVNPPSDWLKIEYWPGPRESSGGYSVTLNRETGKQVLSGQDSNQVPLPMTIQEKLHDAAMELERRFRAPQDVEFLISGEEDTLYLVQTRPITAYSYSPDKVRVDEQQKLSTILDKNRRRYHLDPVLSSTNISELFTRAIPLGYSIFKYGFAGTSTLEGGISIGRSRLGYARLDPIDGARLFYTVADQARTNLIVDALTFRLPGISKRQYLDIFVHHYLEQIARDPAAANYPEDGLYLQTDDPAPWLAIAGDQGDHLRAQFAEFLDQIIQVHAPREYGNASDFFQQNDRRYRAYLERNLHTTSPDKLRQEIEDVLTYLRTTFCPQYVVYARLAFLCTHVAKTRLSDLLGTQSRFTSERILNELLCRATLPAELEEPQYPEFERLFRLGRVLLPDFLHTFQHLGSLDITQPRLGEYSLDKLREVFGQGSEDGFDSELPEAGDNDHVDIDMTELGLDNDPAFRTLYTYAGQFMRLREKAKSELLKLLWVLKRAFIELARLNRFGDLIYYLELHEALTLGPQKRDSLRTLALRREAYLEVCRQHRVKNVLSDLQSPPFEKKPLVDDQDGSSRYRFVRGKTIFYGRAEGFCLTASSNEEFIDKLAAFRTKNIESIVGVFRGVDLSYFNVSALAGFATESGGFLSHAATIARESRLAYITGIGFDQFRDEDYVILDTENDQAIIRR